MQRARENRRILLCAASSEQQLMSAERRDLPPPAAAAGARNRSQINVVVVAKSAWRFLSHPRDSHQRYSAAADDDDDGEFPHKRSIRIIFI